MYPVSTIPSEHLEVERCQASRVRLTKEVTSVEQGIFCTESAIHQWLLTSVGNKRYYTGWILNYIIPQLQCDFYCKALTKYTWRFSLKFLTSVSCIISLLADWNRILLFEVFFLKEKLPCLAFVQSKFYFLKIPVNYYFKKCFFWGGFKKKRHKQWYCFNICWVLTCLWE